LLHSVYNLIFRIALSEALSKSCDNGAERSIRPLKVKQLPFLISFPD